MGSLYGWYNWYLRALNNHFAKQQGVSATRLGEDYSKYNCCSNHNSPEKVAGLAERPKFIGVQAVYIRNKFEMSIRRTVRDLCCQKNCSEKI